MTGMIEFAFEGQGVRMEVDAGEPWFVLSDVCRVLEIKQAHRAAASLDDDEKGRHTVTTLGGNQEMTVINESGLYSLILRSRKPEARRFKKWVTSDVLPTLRRSGAYVMTADDPDMPTNADGNLFGMKVAQINAAARLISAANAIYGPDAARKLWESEPGLPRIGDYSIRGQADRGYDDPEGCLAALLAFPASPAGSIGDLFRLAMTDKATARALEKKGILVDAPAAKGWTAVANRHPFLLSNFSANQWGPDWRIALGLLPNAKPSGGMLHFGAVRSHATLIPHADIARRLSQEKVH